MVRQVSDKADRVGEQYLNAAGKREFTRGGVECCEKLVLGENACVRELIEKRGFTGVGVADYRNLGNTRALTRFALGKSAALEVIKLSVKLFLTAAKMSSV